MQIDYLIILIIMTILGSIASLFLKRASGGSSILAIACNPNLYVGGVLYILSAVLNIYLLRFLDYTVVLPLTSLTYVWTIIIAYFVFKEKVNMLKIAGLCLIFIGGVILVR